MDLFHTILLVIWYFAFFTYEIAFEDNFLKDFFSTRHVFVAPFSQLNQIIEF